MRIIFSFFSLLLFASCNTNVNSSYNIFKEDSWHADSIITISHSVVDSTTKHNLYLKVSHSIDFEYQNIFLFVSFKEKTDTVEFVLSEKSGKWLGKGFGDIKEVDYCFAENVTINSNQASSITIEQAMRYGDEPEITSLKGIIALGLNIEKSEK
jgi:gliding motility-associated lipoprotein GldH